jgi:hypothetical protein
MPSLRFDSGAILATDGGISWQKLLKKVNVTDETTDQSIKCSINGNGYHESVLNRCQWNGWKAFCDKAMSVITKQIQT